MVQFANFIVFTQLTEIYSQQSIKSSTFVDRFPVTET